MSSSGKDEGRKWLGCSTPFYHVFETPETEFRNRIGSREEKAIVREGSIGNDSKIRSALTSVLAKKNGEKYNFFEDEQVRKTGSIFERRKDMQYVKEALPRARLNGFHIKMEDDCPQGGDDTRLSVLRALGTHNCRTVPCVLCERNLVVYDRYPLIDGTFFLSPVQHSKAAVNMKFETGYLHAICITCMHTEWKCPGCGNSGWFLGSALIVGTLYTYDVLSSTICCIPVCRHCRALSLICT
ncbi:unnamed protein product [Brugia pahangi]|uniref:Headcase domain-containing protein n=1 Tax=Brugia pahangi TaxID=6280 RepID=A0A0N4SWN3_BRUPA|nr:unnamed protein product [Brugia pahangi]